MSLVDWLILFSPALAVLFAATTVVFGVALACKPTRRGLTRRRRLFSDRSTEGRR